MWSNIKTYIISIAITLSVGGLSGFLIKDSIPKYESLNLPALAPPSILFPIVWTVLYVLMGISAAMVYQSAIKRTAGSGSYLSSKGAQALFVYGLQLLVNFFWPILFFNLEMRLTAFYWLILLIFLVIVMIVKFLEVDRTAALLQIPYLVWLFYASYLNFSIYMLNRS